MRKYLLLILLACVSFYATHKIPDLRRAYRMNQIMLKAEHSGNPFDITKC
jgi:hypothetical protein